MRAVTGAIVSSKPCPLLKAAWILDRFCDSAASHLPSSDAFTYLRAATDAATHHHRFRRELRRAHAYGDAEREEKPRLERGRDGERDADLVVAAAGGSRHGPAAEVGSDTGEKKSKKKKRKGGLQEEDTHAAGIASYAPASPEISSEKRKLKKQKHGDGGREASVAKEDTALVGEVETGSERKKDKKKRDKYRVKLEDEVNDVKEEVVQMAFDGVADQEIAGGEKKKKKRKHAEELGDTKGVIVKEEMVADGDLGSEKKRKKKRGRGVDDNNELDQVEHAKKKQKKQS